jgi:hypothetical protein
MFYCYKVFCYKVSSLAVNEGHTNFWRAITQLQVLCGNKNLAWRPAEPSSAGPFVCLKLWEKLGKAGKKFRKQNYKNPPRRPE